MNPDNQPLALSLDMGALLGRLLVDVVEEEDRGRWSEGQGAEVDVERDVPETVMTSANHATVASRGVFKSKRLSTMSPWKTTCWTCQRSFICSMMTRQRAVSSQHASRVAVTRSVGSARD